MVNGSMINRMDREKRYGLMGHILKEIMLMEINIMEHTLLLMVQHIKDTLKMVVFVVMVNIYGLMEENILEIGRIIR